VDEPAEVAARRTMAQRKLHLADAQSRPRGVDRHPHLAAEAGRNREARRPCRSRERALSRKRLAHLDAAERADQTPGHMLRQTEASPHSFSKSGDGQIAPQIQQCSEVAGEIGVTEQQRSGRRGALGSGQRLALAATR